MGASGSLVNLQGLVGEFRQAKELADSINEWAFDHHCRPQSKNAFFDAVTGLWSNSFTKTFYQVTRSFGQNENALLEDKTFSEIF